MEEHRLTPMVEGYDEKTFNQLYSECSNLIKSLSRNIDCRRFGVDREEVQSWFTVKFIFVFNKYYNKFRSNKEVLKGHIISALSLYQYRIMRQAYTVKFSQSIVNYEDIGILEGHIEPEHIWDQENDPKEQRYTIAMGYMKQNLSENAYEVLQLQLNPPPYIIKQLNSRHIDNLQKIPDEVICDYLGIDTTPNGVKYIYNLREEIKVVTYHAKHYFTTSLS